MSEDDQEVIFIHPRKSGGKAGDLTPTPVSRPLSGGNRTLRLGMSANGGKADLKFGSAGVRWTSASDP